MLRILCRVSREDARTDAVLMRRNVCPFRDSNEDSLSVPSLAYRTQPLLFSYYCYYYLQQLSFHSVAVVLTLVTNKNKYTYKKQYKNTIQIIKNTISTSMHITKTPTHYKTHTYKHPHITKPTHTNTHTLQNPHIQTPTH